ncbi:MAG TPA: hypothetical protein DCS82_07465, partial [Rhodospirillaceae bacterium]|nr:hypothetical protein [Rhodospirillaceae bacterium]
MKLQNSFDVAAAPAEAWSVLVDVARVAPCVPGAELTEIIDENAYKGSVKVKLGPVSLAFDGEARFVERDDTNFSATIKADGREAKGRGGAQADVDISLAASEAGSTVTIETELSLNGPVAQYGRSQGVIASVAEEMVAQFSACLRDKVLSGEVAPAASDESDESGQEVASGFAILFGAFKRWLRSLFGKGS